MDQPSAIAEKLANDWWAPRAAYEKLSGDLAPAGVADAYAAQGALQAKLADRRGPIAGRKIALSSKAMQQMVGIDQPVAGAFFAHDVHTSPATIALSLALTCATVQTTVSTAAASEQHGGALTVEVIVRDEVAEGDAPSFEVVETDLSGMLDLLANPEDGTTTEPNSSAWITLQPTDPQA